MFLEDIRKYREEKMSNTGVKCIFPIWGENTTKLAESIVTKDEKIEFVGSSDEAMKLYGKSAVSIVASG